WTTHATGLLGQHGAVQPTPLTDWPPTGTEPVDAENVYDELAGLGLEYGPLFQGLRAAWRGADGEVFAEVALPDGADAASYGIHPALLDAALHAIGYGEEQAETETAKLPFSWRGVALHATGATALRVRITTAGADSVTLAVADDHGRPVATIGALDLRTVSAEQLVAAGDADSAHEDLFRLAWEVIPAAPAFPFGQWVVAGDDGLGLLPALKGVEIEAVDRATIASLREEVAAGAPVPSAVLVPLGAVRGGPAAPVGDLAVTARAAAHRVLGLLHEWLADDMFAETPMVFVTSGAVAATPGDEVTDLVHAPVWGLIRAAQSENPGRFLLVDVDDLDSVAGLASAVGCGEPQLAVRDNRTLVPRLVRTGPGGGGQGGVSRAFGEGTVLVTGGTGALGALVARHLVVEHGVRS
ncbi:polyketide synthase dehydratase domain-containing protein, partial [Streptomyces sp. NPDC059176]|uniref:polyketide synthase dehydratase domain-containing protein n=1 Tax=Streptomyces sp. NPDC059176 TaxID=3346758 RepID=UPI00368D952C